MEEFPSGLRVRLAAQKTQIQRRLYGADREPVGSLGTVDTSRTVEGATWEVLMVAVYWDCGTASWVTADQLEVCPAD